MTQAPEDLVTVVRYRTVVEEVVLSRAEFDRANAVENPDDLDQLMDAQERIDQLPFQDWQWGTYDYFPEPVGYMAFAGDVTSYSDDAVMCSKWQRQAPLTVDEDLCD